MIHARRGSLIKGSRTELEVNLNAKRIITLLMAAVMAMALLGCNAANTTPTPAIGNEATPTPPLTPTITSEPPTPVPTPTPTPAPTKDVSAMPEQAVFTELFSIKVGEGKNEIGYLNAAPLYVSGPTSFHVDEDDWIAILDPNRGRIMIFDDNELAHILDLRDELAYPYHMCYADGGFYIVDIGYEYILYAAFTMDDVGKTGCETKVYEIPEETTALLIIDIYATEKGVILDGAVAGEYHTSFNYWILDLKRGEFIPTDEYQEFEESEGETIIRTLGDEWHLPMAENCSFEIYGIDNHGFLYVGYYEDFYAEVGASTLEKTIRCYNSEGRQFGAARIDIDKYSSYPNVDTVVLEDGTIYHMACYEDRITIYEVTLGQRYETRKEELIERAIQKREEAQRRTADPDAP